MGTFKKFLHHVDIGDVKKKHLEEIAAKKLKEEREKEEKKFIVNTMKEIKYDWRSSLYEKMSTGTAFAYTAAGQPDADVATIDASLETSFGHDQKGVEAHGYSPSGLMGGVAIKPSGSGTGGGGFDIGKHLAFTGDSYYNVRWAALTPVDSTAIDTITITAIRGNDSNGGEDPDAENEDLEVWYRNADMGQNMWTPINQDPAGNTISGVEKIIIPIGSDSSGLRDWTLPIPAHARTTSTQFMLFQATSSGAEFDHYGVTKISFKRNAPVNVVVSLDDPAASAFIRVGGPAGEKSDPKKRKKKVQDMLDASDEYVTKTMGDNFPGTGVSLDPIEASPVGKDQVAKSFEKAGTPQKTIQKFLQTDDITGEPIEKKIEKSFSQFKPEVTPQGEPAPDPIPVNGNTNVVFGSDAQAMMTIDDETRGELKKAGFSDKDIQKVLDAGGAEDLKAIVGGDVYAGVMSDDDGSSIPLSNTMNKGTSINFGTTFGTGSGNDYKFLKFDHNGIPILGLEKETTTTPTDPSDAVRRGVQQFNKDGTFDSTDWLGTGWEQSALTRPPAHILDSLRRQTRNGGKDYSIEDKMNVIQWHKDLKAQGLSDDQRAQIHTQVAGTGGSPGQPYTPPKEDPNNPWVPAPGKDTKLAELPPEEQIAQAEQEAELTDDEKEELKNQGKTEEEIKAAEEEKRNIFIEKGKDMLFDLLADMDPFDVKVGIVLDSIAGFFTIVQQIRRGMEFFNLVPKQAAVGHSKLLNDIAIFKSNLTGKITTHTYNRAQIDALADNLDVSKFKGSNYYGKKSTAGAGGAFGISDQRHEYADDLIKVVNGRVERNDGQYRTTQPLANMYSGVEAIDGIGRGYGQMIIPSDGSTPYFYYYDYNYLNLNSPDMAADSDNPEVPSDFQMFMANLAGGLRKILPGRIWDDAINRFRGNVDTFATNLKERVGLDGWPPGVHGATLTDFKINLSQLPQETQDMINAHPLSWTDERISKMTKEEIFKQYESGSKDPGGKEWFNNNIIEIMEKNHIELDNIMDQQSELYGKKSKITDQPEYTAAGDAAREYRDSIKENYKELIDNVEKEIPLPEGDYPEWDIDNDPDMKANKEAAAKAWDVYQDTLSKAEPAMAAYEAHAATLEKRGKYLYGTFDEIEELKRLEKEQRDALAPWDKAADAWSALLDQQAKISTAYMNKLEKERKPWDDVYDKQREAKDKLYAERDEKVKAAQKAYEDTWNDPGGGLINGGDWKHPETGEVIPGMDTLKNNIEKEIDDLDKLMEPLLLGWYQDVLKQFKAWNWKTNYSGYGDGKSWTPSGGTPSGKGKGKSNRYQQRRTELALNEPIVRDDDYASYRLSGRNLFEKLKTRRYNNRRPMVDMAEIKKKSLNHKRNHLEETISNSTSGVLSGGKRIPGAGDVDLMVLQTGLTGDGGIDYGEDGFATTEVSGNSTHTGVGEYTGVTAWEPTETASDPTNVGTRFRPLDAFSIVMHSSMELHMKNIPGYKGGVGATQLDIGKNYVVAGGGHGHIEDPEYGKHDAIYSYTVDELGKEHPSYNNTDGLTDQGHGSAVIFKNGTHWAPLKPIDTSEFDTLKVRARIKQGYIQSPADAVQIYYWAGDKPGFQSLAKDNIIHNQTKPHDGWRPLYQKPDGSIDNSVSHLIIPWWQDRPDRVANNGKLADYSVKIPEWCRGENSRFIIYSKGSQMNSWAMTSVRFQRRNAVTVGAPLDSPEASSFVRVGQGSADTSPEQRKKKIEDMLKASRLYLMKVLGYADFPGMGATLDKIAASPVGFDKIYDTHAATLSPEDRRKFRNDLSDRVRGVGKWRGKIGDPLYKNRGDGKYFYKVTSKDSRGLTKTAISRTPESVAHYERQQRQRR